MSIGEELAKQEEGVLVHEKESKNHTNHGLKKEDNVSKKGNVVGKNGQNSRRLLFMLGEEIEHLLDVVEALDFPDAWIAGGYLRNRVWNALHGFNKPQNDIDVIYFDAGLSKKASDKFEAEVQDELGRQYPGFEWSLTNQAWAHIYKDDPPYEDSFEAIRRYPETCTAVACQMVDYHSVRVAAPHGLDDLFNLIIRPSPGFREGEPLHEMFINRVYRRTWLKAWPKLKVELQ